MIALFLELIFERLAVESVIVKYSYCKVKLVVILHKICVLVQSPNSMDLELKF